MYNTAERYFNIDIKTVYYIKIFFTYNWDMLFISCIQILFLMNNCELCCWNKSVNMYMYIFNKRTKLCTVHLYYN